MKDLILRSFPPGECSALRDVVRDLFGVDEAERVADVKGWRDVPGSAIPEVGGKGGAHLLAYLEPPAFAHYVPGWMLHVADNGMVVDLMASCLQAVLDPSYDRHMFPEGSEPWFMPRATVFDAAQADVIATFLGELAKSPRTNVGTGSESQPAAAWWRERASELAAS